MHETSALVDDRSARSVRDDDGGAGQRRLTGRSAANLMPEMSVSASASRTMWFRLFELGGRCAVVARGPEMKSWVDSALAIEPLSDVPLEGSFETVLVDLSGDEESDVRVLARVRSLLIPDGSCVWAFVFGEYPDWCTAQDVIHRSGFAEARLVEPSSHALAFRLVPDPPPFF